MNDTTKGELVIVLLISLLAIGCGTACGINNVVENICGNIIPSSLTETEDIIDEIENNNVSLQVSNESVNNIDYVGNEIHKDKSKINDNTSTVDNNTNNTKDIKDEYLFNRTVRINTRDGEVVAKIVSRVGDHILTSTNKKILLSDIISISEN